MDFIVRIHQDTTNNPVLSYLTDITISNITLISKPLKFGGICEHKGNQKKFGYSFTISKSFSKVSGSHSLPNLSFKGHYVDIIVKNFPRYPAFYQDYAFARNILAGYNKGLPMGNGFPHQLLFRNIEIII